MVKLAVDVSRAGNESISLDRIRKILIYVIFSCGRVLLVRPDSCAPLHAVNAYMHTLSQT